YGIIVLPTAADLISHETISSSVYGSGVLSVNVLDLATGEVGIKGTVTLLNLDQHQNANVNLAVDANNKLCLNGKAHIYDDITALKGNLTAYLKYQLPWDDSPNEYDDVLWTYPGFHWGGDIYNDKVT